MTLNEQFQPCDKDEQERAWTDVLVHEFGIAAIYSFIIKLFVLLVLYNNSDLAAP